MCVCVCVWCVRRACCAFKCCLWHGRQLGGCGYGCEGLVCVCVVCVVRVVRYCLTLQCVRHASPVALVYVSRHVLAEVLFWNLIMILDRGTRTSKFMCTHMHTRTHRHTQSTNTILHTHLNVQGRSQAHVMHLDARASAARCTRTAVPYPGGYATAAEQQHSCRTFHLCPP